MPEQMVKMMSTFIKWLPDMDILLNENDECRVVIPWELKKELLRKEEERRLEPDEKYINAFPKTTWLGTSLKILC
jgi:hypothetical protein